MTWRKLWEADMGWWGVVGEGVACHTEDETREARWNEVKWRSVSATVNRIHILVVHQNVMFLQSTVLESICNTFVMKDSSSWLYEHCIEPPNCTMKGNNDWDLSVIVHCALTIEL